MKFLVPVDGSPSSLRALSRAIELAKAERQASIVLLNVQNQAPASLSKGAGAMLAEWIEEEAERAGEEALEAPVATCQAAGVRFTARGERGAPAATIDRIAREDKVDHIVMGTRGLGGIRGLLLGSVATQVLHLTDLPVTLVK